MKKTYFAPIVNIVKIKTHQLMQASNGMLDNGKSITTSEGFGSRRGRSLWDDDDEEEEEY